MLRIILNRMQLSRVTHFFVFSHCSSLFSLPENVKCPFNTCPFRCSNGIEMLAHQAHAKHPGWSTKYPQGDARSWHCEGCGKLITPTKSPSSARNVLLRLHQLHTFLLNFLATLRFLTVTYVSTLGRVLNFTCPLEGMWYLVGYPSVLSTMMKWLSHEVYH